MEDYRHDPVVRDAGFVVTRDHAVWGSVDHSGTTARLSATPPRLGNPTPYFGQDTDGDSGGSGILGRSDRGAESGGGGSGAKSVKQRR